MDQAPVQKRREERADQVSQQINPDESRTQQQSSRCGIADCIEPISIDQLTQFDSNTEAKCEQTQPQVGTAGKHKRQQQIHRYSPQSIPGVLRNKPRQQHNDDQHGQYGDAASRIFKVIFHAWGISGFHEDFKVRSPVSSNNLL